MPCNHQPIGPLVDKCFTITTALHLNPVELILNDLFLGLPVVFKGLFGGDTKLTSKMIEKIITETDSKAKTRKTLHCVSKSWCNFFAYTEGDSSKVAQESQGATLSPDIP